MLSHSHKLNKCYSLIRKKVSSISHNYWSSQQWVSFIGRFLFVFKQDEKLGRRFKSLRWRGNGHKDVELCERGCRTSGRNQLRQPIDWPPGCSPFAHRVPQCRSAALARCPDRLCHRSPRHGRRCSHRGARRRQPGPRPACRMHHRPSSRSSIQHTILSTIHLVHPSWPP